MPFAQSVEDVSHVAGLAGVIGAGQTIRLAAASPEMHDGAPPATLPERSEQTLHVR